MSPAKPADDARNGRLDFEGRGSVRGQLVGQKHATYEARRGCKHTARLEIVHPWAFYA